MPLAGLVDPGYRLRSVSLPQDSIFLVKVQFRRGKGKKAEIAYGTCALVRPDLVLTAFHVVAPLDRNGKSLGTTVCIEVYIGNLNGAGERWWTAEVVWHGHELSPPRDVALLQLKGDPLPVSLRAIRLNPGPVTSRKLDTRGFAEAAADPGGARNYMPVSGRIHAAESDRLPITVDQTVHGGDTDLWSGASGMPVLDADGICHGVVATVYNSVPNLLEATAISALVGNAAFARLTGLDGGGWVAGVRRGLEMTFEQSPKLRDALRGVLARIGGDPGVQGVAVANRLMELPLREAITVFAKVIGRLTQLGQGSDAQQGRQLLCRLVTVLCESHGITEGWFDFVAATPSMTEILMARAERRPGLFTVAGTRIVQGATGRWLENPSELMQPTNQTRLLQEVAELVGVTEGKGNLADRVEAKLRNRIEDAKLAEPDDLEVAASYYLVVSNVEAGTLAQLENIVREQMGLRSLRLVHVRVPVESDRRVEHEQVGLRLAQIFGTNPSENHVDG